MVADALPYFQVKDGVSFPLLAYVLTLAKRLGQKWHTANVRDEL